MTTKRHKVLVLGAAGMLGNAVLRYFAERGRDDVYGTVRSDSSARLLPDAVRKRVLVGVDVENFDNLLHTFELVAPSVVINCVGVVKQLDSSHDPLIAIPINSILPHRLARISALVGARMLQVSTDCVYSGRQGNYAESDLPDAEDLYGRSKLLGEIDYPHAVTLRTSIIGHELQGKHGLIGWLLSQSDSVRGYAKAIFSGLPTVELARVMHDFVLPKVDLRGVYNVSGAPIDKYSLLNMVAQVYGSRVKIQRDETIVIDRSLDSTRFRTVTGYEAPAWSELIAQMRAFG